MRTQSSISSLKALLLNVLLWTFFTPWMLANATVSNSTHSLTQPHSPSTVSPTVVSLSPAATELIYELGLEQHLLAVDQNSNFPEAAQQLPSVGDPFQPNAELLSLYRPDWVISFSTNHIINQLQKQIGFQAWELYPQDMDDLLHQAQQLATRLVSSKKMNDTLVSQQLVSETVPSSSEQQATTLALSEASRAIQSWQSLWHNIQHKYTIQSNKTFFIYLDGSPMYTVGPDTFLSRGIQACGLRSAFEQQSQPSFIISPEALLLHSPDKVIAGISVNEVPAKRRAFIQENLHRIGLNISNNQIVLVPTDVLFRPSIRFLKALPQICEQLQSQPEE